MSVSKFLAGFVVGGAIGAIAGILLAPKSGEETRKILADTAQDMVRKQMMRFPICRKKVKKSKKKYRI